MPTNLGQFEIEVLTALTTRVRDAYGLTIADEIKANTGRAPSLGALYTTLDRLEKKGLIKSTWSEPTAVRGGRRKRLYALTGAGSAALHEGVKKMRLRGWIPAGEASK